MQLIKEYKSIVNGLIKTISDKFKTLQKLHLIKILRQIFFDHHPVTYKFDENFHDVAFKEQGHN